MENKNLDIKIALWTHEDKLLEATENKNSNVAVIFSAFIGLVTILFKDKNDHLVFLGIPLITCFALFYLAFNTRVVASRRGYLSKLESEINDNLDKNLFLWSSRYIDDFYKFKHFKTNVISPIIFGLVFLGINLFSIYKIHELSICTDFLLILFLALILTLDGFFIYELVTNRKKIKESEDFAGREMLKKTKS
jgi:hypothetical protein